MFYYFFKTNLTIDNKIFIFDNNKREMQNSSFSEEDFQYFFEKAPIGKSITLPDGTLDKINQAFAEMLGYTLDEMFHINFAEITHPDDL